MDKLKPCPFCGGEDLEKGRYKMPICCNKCGAFFTLCNSCDPEEIEEAWNRRTSDMPLPEPPKEET